MSSTVRLSGSKFNYIMNGVLFLTALIYGQIQKVVYACLKPRFVYRWLYARLAGHLRERRVYEFL